MNPGDLRHRVTVKRQHTQTDLMGGFSDSWEDEAEVWAAIWPVSAKEIVQNQQLVGQVSHRVRVRYLSTLTTAMKLVFGTRTFRILSIINPEERGIYLDLMCLEEV
jgi:SPP1 family predicted phage head-tail adaptor